MDTGQSRYRKLGAPDIGAIIELVCTECDGAPLWTIHCNHEPLRLVQEGTLSFRERGPAERLARALQAGDIPLVISLSS